MNKNMGILPSNSIGDLTKHLAIKDKNAFKVLKDIMYGKVERKEEERVEAIISLFKYSYQFGCLKTGKEAMELLFLLMQFPVYHRYYSNLLLNVAFYALPINISIKHNLRQRLFGSLNNLNPFLFRDTVTNDYIVGSRIMNLNRNKGSDYEIYVYSNEGDLLHNFSLKYQFNYKRFNRLGATHGVEDVRVINIPDETNVFLASGTTMDTHAQGMIKMSMFYMHVQRDSTNHIEAITAKNLIPLQGIEDDKKQKNWLPFFHNKQLYFIYKFDPITIIKAKLNSFPHEEKKYSGVVEKINPLSINPPIIKTNATNTSNNTTTNTPTNNTMNEITKHGFTFKTNHISKARGSAPPLFYLNDQQENAWLFIVHYAESKHKKYYHRFVEMDLNFRVTRTSRIFYFERCNGIEFAINIIFHRDEEDGFLISYGHGDIVSHVSFLSFYDLSRSWLLS